MKKFLVELTREFEVTIDDEKLLKDEPEAFEVISYALFGCDSFEELAEKEATNFDLYGKPMLTGYVTVEKLEECFRTEEKALEAEDETVKKIEKIEKGELRI